MEQQQTVHWQGQPHPAVNFWVYLSCITLVSAPYAMYCYARTKRTTYQIIEEWLKVDDGHFMAVKIKDIERTQIDRPKQYAWLGIADLAIITATERMTLRGLLDAEQVQRIIEKHRQKALSAG